MSPDWNIKGCIIEPGGFDSEWRGNSMKHAPVHPAYRDPSNPCAMFRAMHAGRMENLGSSVRMAQALYKLADAPELPLRIQFGSESLFLIKTQATKTIREADRFAEVSHSTNREDMDGEQYVQKILLATGNFDRNKD